VTTAVDALRALEKWGHAREWAGSDPYDALNARRLSRPMRASVLGRRVATQVVKRSPVNLRPLLGVPPGRSAAAIGHVLSAYSMDVPLDERRARASQCVSWLSDMRLPNYEQACWGYHFDVQTSVLRYPRTEPNTIATAFAGMALVDAYEAFGDEQALSLARGAASFFLEHVPQTEGDGGAYFGYLVGDRTPIHNASMLVCALLARVHAVAPDPSITPAVERGVAYCQAHQRDDGSWPYGERDDLGWVDGFHTGYVLDSLVACAKAGVGDVDDAAIERGLAYYRRELFESDGTPKYYPDETYPIDSQCVAQGIQTFALAGDVTHACKVFDWSQEHMRRSDGAYVFQRRRRWANRTPHVRWTQAPMLTALAHLVEAQS
jgi:hypothetical protein